MSWEVVWTNRTGRGLATPPGLAVLPKRYRWSALGGPVLAEIEVTGRPLDLWRLVGWLRYGVEIRNPLQRPVWWGYVAEIAVQVGAIQVGVSLDTLYNRVAVVYSYVEPGSQTVGTRQTTAWAQDDASVAEYGVKEHRASVDGATAAQAENTRDILLAQHRLPLPVPDVAGSDKLRATLTCRGWWETLRWRYYANGATNSVETTAQIAAIVAAVGAFFTGTDLQVASGIHVSEYQDGDSTALDIIQTLLRAGVAGGQRLLATVTRERLLRVDAEPASTSVRHSLTTDGVITDRLGQPLDAGVIPVGRWIDLGDVIPPTAPTAYLAKPSPFFLEAGEYDVERGRLTPEPRGVPSPWDLTRVGEG